MPIRTTCPHCHKDGTVPDTAAGKTIRCPGCGEKWKIEDKVESVQTHRPQTEDPSKSEALTSNFAWKVIVSREIGSILLIGGLCFMAYFFSMDTTVPISDNINETRRVHNIGLIEDRRNGLLVSMFASAMGLAISVIGQKFTKESNQINHAQLLGFLSASLKTVGLYILAGVIAVASMLAMVTMNLDFKYFFIALGSLIVVIIITLCVKAIRKN